MKKLIKNAKTIKGKIRSTEKSSGSKRDLKKIEKKSLKIGKKMVKKRGKNGGKIIGDSENGKKNER